MAAKKSTTKKAAAKRPAKPRPEPVAEVEAPPAEPVLDAAEPDADPEAGKFYCPGCGKRFDSDDADCTGRYAEAPHAPITPVSTAELGKGDDHHTPAPNTGEILG